MSGQVTVGDGELGALAAAFGDVGGSVREVRPQDAATRMARALPGSHVSWVAQQVGAVLDRQVAATADRVARLGDAARSSGDSYDVSDSVRARLFDRLGR